MTLEILISYMQNYDYYIIMFLPYNIYIYIFYIGTTTKKIIKISLSSKYLHIPLRIFSILVLGRYIIGNITPLYLSLYVIWY